MQECIVETLRELRGYLLSFNCMAILSEASKEERATTIESIGASRRSE